MQIYDVSIDTCDLSNSPMATAGGVNYWEGSSMADMEYPPPCLRGNDDPAGKAARAAFMAKYNDLYPEYKDSLRDDDACREHWKMAALLDSQMGRGSTSAPSQAHFPFQGPPYHSPAGSGSAPPSFPKSCLSGLSCFQKKWRRAKQQKTLNSFGQCGPHSMKRLGA